MSLYLWSIDSDQPFSLVSCISRWDIQGVQFAKGKQIWFEVEAFDERSPHENYKLGEKEKAVKLGKDAFGDIVTNTGGKGPCFTGLILAVLVVKPASGVLSGG